MKTDSSTHACTYHSLGWWQRDGGRFQGLIYAESDRRPRSKIITQLGPAIPVACLNNLSQIVRRSAHIPICSTDILPPSVELHLGSNSLWNFSRWKHAAAFIEKLQMEKLKRRCDWIGRWGGFHGANWQYVSKLSGHYPNMGRAPARLAEPPVWTSLLNGYGARLGVFFFIWLFSPSTYLFLCSLLMQCKAYFYFLRSDLGATTELHNQQKLYYLVRPCT